MRWFCGLSWLPKIIANHRKDKRKQMVEGFPGQQITFREILGCCAEAADYEEVPFSLLKRCRTYSGQNPVSTAKSQCFHTGQREPPFPEPRDP